jgi:hypothetical protein
MVTSEKDQQDLLAKALFETDREGLDPQGSTIFILELPAILERIL